MALAGQLTGGAGGRPPGTTLSRGRVALSRWGHEIWVFAFENLRRRYGSREGAPQPRPSRPVNVLIFRPGKPHAGRRVGAGAASVDPYLLRSIPEAGNRHLVAALRAEMPMRLSVVHGGCPRPHPA